MTRLPPLNALKAFEAAGRHLNFRLAAEDIGVTHGAVAQQVRALEARLGVKLFHRLPRGLELTDEGRKYLTPIHHAFALIADATDKLCPHQAELTVSVTPSFATKWLVPRLGQFTEVHPDINVTVDASQRLANFQDDGIDIAVRQGTPPFGPGLVADQLFAQEFYAVCHPSLLNGKHPLRAPEDLAHHVLLHDAHGLWPLFLEKIFANRPRPVLRSMSFNQTALAVDAAVAGQGVALVSDPLVSRELADGRLCRPFEQSLSGGLSFYVVAPRKPRKPETVERMRHWLLSQAHVHDDFAQGP
ncbi:MAG: transcriptional regulator GcvA [Pseudomonadota bacterium]